MLARPLIPSPEHGAVVRRRYAGGGSTPRPAVRTAHAADPHIARRSWKQPGRSSLHPGLLGLQSHALLRKSQTSSSVSPLQSPWKFIPLIFNEIHEKFCKELFFPSYSTRLGSILDPEQQPKPTAGPHLPQISFQNTHSHTAPAGNRCPSARGHQAGAAGGPGPGQTHGRTDRGGQGSSGPAAAEERQRSFPQKCLPLISGRNGSHSQAARLTAVVIARCTPWPG